MRIQPAKITLGDLEWVIRPLTLRQVQAIEPILINSTAATGNVASALSIVEIALQRDHAEAAKSLLDTEASAGEIAAAMATVLRLGGFIAQETSSGEAEPPEGAAE